MDVNSCVSIKSAFWSGYTALHFACTFLQSDVVEVLLDYGADVTLKNELGLTPLELIFKKSKFLVTAENDKFLKIFDLLLCKCMSSNSFKDNGLLLFNLACAKNDTVTVKHLSNAISINQPVTLPNWLGRTPLHFAAFFNNQEVMEMLLGLGADPTVQDAEGLTPLILGIHK